MRLKNDYLFEAEKLYKNKRFEDCLELLYKYSGFAKGLNWTLFAASTLLCGLSVWLLTRDVAVAIVAVAVAIVAVAVSGVVSGVVAFAFAVSGVVAFAFAGVAAAFAGAAFLCGLIFSEYPIRFCCWLSIRHEKIIKH